MPNIIIMKREYVHWTLAAGRSMSIESNKYLVLKIHKYFQRSPADLRYDHVLSVLVDSKCYLSRTKVHQLVTDSCSAE